MTWNPMKWFISLLFLDLMLYTCTAHATVSVKTGSFAANTGTGNQAVTGLGFQPKAVLLWSTGATATGDVAPAAISGTYNVGFATDSTHRAALSVFDTGFGQSDTAIQYFADQVTPPRADFVSMDSGGFTINWVTAPGTARLIFYYAVGGVDVTNATVKEIQAPATTGVVSYTGLGFTPSACVFLTAGSAQTPPYRTASGDSAQSIGFYAGGTTQVNTMMAVNSATPGSWTRQKTDRAISAIDATTGGTTIKGVLQSLDTDGFTVNWATTVSNAYVWALCLKGGIHSVGTFVQPTTTGTQPVTGLNGSPKGLILSSAELTANPGPTQPMTYAHGQADSASSRASVGKFTDNSQSANFDASSLQTGGILKFFTATSPSTVNTQAVADLTSFDTNGFTLNWTTVDSTAREIAYWAIANTVAFDTLTWNESDSGTTQFNVERSTTQNGNVFQQVSLIPGGAGTFSTQVTYTTETNRCFRVNAGNAAGVSPYSNTACAGTALTIGPATQTTPLTTGQNCNLLTTQTATGGTPAYTFTQTGGPAGCSLNSGSGAWSGTVGATGTYTTSVTVVDSLSVSSTKVYSISVIPFLVQPPSQGPLAVNTSCTQLVTQSATGAVSPYTFTSSNRPTGCSLSSGGIWTGTASATGTFATTVTATDSTGGTPLTSTINYSIVVTGPIIAPLTQPTLTQGQACSLYTTQTATGGTAPYTWSIVSGAPTGCSLSSGGVYSGTTSASGTFTTIVKVTDNVAATNTITYTNVINPIAVIPPLNFSPAILPVGTVGLSYSQQITVTNGVPTYSCTASGVPNGLSVSAGCLLSGTPTLAGNYSVAVTATDSRSPTATVTVNTYPLQIDAVVTPPNPPSNVTITWSWSGLDTLGLPEHLRNFEIGRATTSAGPFTGPAVIANITLGQPFKYVDMAATSPTAWYTVTAIDTNGNRSTATIPICYGSGCPASTTDQTPPSAPFSPVAR